MNLTNPDTSILESVLGVEVFEDERKKENEFFPRGAAIASEFLVDTSCNHLYIYI